MTQDISDEEVMRRHNIIMESAPDFVKQHRGPRKFWAQITRTFDDESMQAIKNEWAQVCEEEKVKGYVPLGHIILRRYDWMPEGLMQFAQYFQLDPEPRN